MAISPTTFPEPIKNTVFYSSLFEDSCLSPGLKNDSKPLLFFGCNRILTQTHFVRRDTLRSERLAHQ